MYYPALSVTVQELDCKVLCADNLALQGLCLTYKNSTTLSALSFYSNTRENNSNKHNYVNLLRKPHKLYIRIERSGIIVILIRKR